MTAAYLPSIQKLKHSFVLLIGIFLSLLSLPAPVSAQADIFGKITAPDGVSKYNLKAGASGIGLMLFVSNMIKLATVIAGIWVFINFVMAGWIYITSSGDSGAHKKVSEKMTMSIMGLAIIVGSYTIAAIIGLIVFGDASYILNPKLKGIQ